jgi:hypothetical protein
MAATHSDSEAFGGYAAHGIAVVVPGASESGLEDIIVRAAPDAAAPDVGDVLSLTAPRTTDLPVNLAAPTSTSANPAAAEVSHLQLANAQLTSELQLPLSELHSAPLLANQHTPSDYDHYITARTATWKAAKARGNAPTG